MLTLLEGGEVYAPEPLGRQPVLLCGGRIVRIGPASAARLRDLGPGLELEVIDAAGCVVAPGLIDPHEHLIGAGGEQGPGSRMPEVAAADIAAAGITTVVGCLGTDTTCRGLGALLGRVRQLCAQGLCAYLYTGGFPVPPPTITSSVRDDLVLIDRVIGVGEIAISDVRSSQPSVAELARLVCEAYVGGTLSGKAGVTHFHVGPSPRRLAPLHALLDEHDVEASAIYATHVNRSPELMDDAVALARRGATVDIDTIDEDLPVWLRRYRERGGPPDRLTASSDAHTTGAHPRKLHGQLVAAVRDGLPLQEVLPLFTSNVARVLKLQDKGRLRAGADADVLVLSARDLSVVHVFCGGRQVVRGGRPCL